MKMKNKILIILALIFLGVILLWVVVAFNKKQGAHIMTVEKASHVPGKIYLTLKNKKNNNFGVYYFDLAKKELKPLYTDDKCDLLGGAVNKENTMAVVTNCSSDNHKAFYLTVDKINSPKKEQRVISNLKAYFKKETAWSSDGKKIAFMEAMPQNQQKGKLAKIEQWRIFVTDMTGQKQFVANAIHPFFSPDNQKILALRKEGVFLFDIAKGSGSSIPLRPIKKDFSFNENTIFTLSSQKDRIALADPDSSKLLVYKIDFKAKNTKQMVNGVREIDLKGNHVLATYFLPLNENYLITIETTTKGETNLVLHNIITQKTETLTKLNNYSQFQINDWK